MMGRHNYTDLDGRRGFDSGRIQHYIQCSSALSQDQVPHSNLVPQSHLVGLKWPMGVFHGLQTGVEFRGVCVIKRKPFCGHVQ